MWEGSLGFCSTYSILIQKSKFHNPWDFYTASLETSCLVIRVNMYNIELLEQFIEARRHYLVVEAIKEPLEIMKLDHEYPKLIQKGVGGIEDYLVLEALDIHLHNHVAGIFFEIFVFPG